MQLKQTAVTMLVVLTSACGSDGPVVPGGEAGVSFQLDGQARAMAGSPSSDPGQILGASFAVAWADSVGGFVLIGYQRTAEGEGNLFVLQSPRDVRTFACGNVPGECHGRYITGVRNASTVTATRYYHVTSGSLTVTQMGPARVRGTFRVVLEADDDQPGRTLAIENGTIDVPYLAHEVTEGTLECLLSRVGVNVGVCRSGQ